MEDKKEQIGEIVRVPIESIKENPINYEIYSSKHSKEDEDLESSIKLYGQLEPCIVNEKTNQLISGHRRYNTIKRLGIDTIDVIYKSVGSFEEYIEISSSQWWPHSILYNLCSYFDTNCSIFTIYFGFNLTHILESDSNRTMES